MRAAFILLSLFAVASTLHADDGAASIAAGGIILMKHEPRIVMAKEVLQISEDKVIVDYDFRNDSDDDITTEVAFPIPPYVDDPDGPSWKFDGFDDFKLAVNNTTTHFQTETRAFVGPREITTLLHNLGIDAASFGHEHQNARQDIVNDLSRLAKSQRERLAALKAIQGVDDLEPNWSVEKKYHWTQTFPAHTTTHIRHQYTPVLGNSNTIGDPSIYQGKNAIAEYAESCPTPALRDSLAKLRDPAKDSYGGGMSIAYVSFILTTANTWQTPIEDFTLIVARPHAPNEKFFVSFCWDGPVTQVDADHFSAHITGLIPAKELQIGFIAVDTK